MKPHDPPSDPRPLIMAGTFMGVGLGGFVDGILFHQILQIHGMLTAKYPKTSIPNMEINMFWDGLFHVFTWLMTVIGLRMLWKAGRRADVPWSGKVFVGSLFLGWGLFNVVEGIIDHHVLNIHHVLESHGQSGFDYAFLGAGLLFILFGLKAIKDSKKIASPARGAAWQEAGR